MYIIVPHDSLKFSFCINCRTMHIYASKTIHMQQFMKAKLFLC